LALIVDEVFLDYRLSDTEDTATSFLAYQATTPTFILSGISKISGLPQMKAAWIVLHGPEATMAEAAQRLDVIADTFLSMSTPLQLALPALLGVRKRIQPQILARLRGNLATLDQMLRAQPLLRRLPVEAGWYCCLTVPVHEPSEASAVRLLQSTGVHVHPGVFFGFEGEGVWVISLLTPSDTLQAGCGRLLAYSEYFE
jgi:aspartate/methionine/tyrosine aminotransferase